MRTLTTNVTLGRACIWLFAISTVFPFVAGAIPSMQGHRWLGIADAAIALILVCTAIALVSRTRTVTDRDRLTAFRLTRGVMNVVPALLIVFFLVGGRIDWDVLVIGLAWRAFLLVHTLPHLAAAVT